MLCIDGAPSGSIAARWGDVIQIACALLALLDLLNQPDLDALWPEDETIGWMYQYFNSREERKAMRDASAAPAAALNEGSTVELIGPHRGVDAVAADADTIGYEVLTSLGRRYHRRYVSEDLQG